MLNEFELQYIKLNACYSSRAGTGWRSRTARRRAPCASSCSTPRRSARRRSSSRSAFEFASHVTPCTPKPLVCLSYASHASSVKQRSCAQTFTVHRSRVSKVMLSEKYLVSVCANQNHVRTWSVTRSALLSSLGLVIKLILITFS